MHVLETSRHERLGPRLKHSPRRESRPSKHTPVMRRTNRAANGGTAAVSEAQKVASRVACLPDGEVRQRYHELVDKRISSALTVLERFELERIETRLDAGDRDSQIEARDRQWEIERAELLESIQNLLSKLRK